MDTLPLPPRPSLAQYRKRAKGLLAAAKSGDPAAVRRWARDWIDALTGALANPPTPFVRGSIDRAFARIEAGSSDPRAPRALTLTTAQHLIAQAHGFASWAAFARHVEGEPGERSSACPSGGDFEAAADAVAAGDLAALDALLRRHPGLVRARSSRVHRATLLHYVAANGVEDFRQKTPPNAVAVARRLLEAGAEPDASAGTYGGDWWQTTMNLLVSSVHPAAAGVQPALVETLLDFGAAADGVRGDESPIMTALDFGYGAAAEALARRGARVDNVVSAAALGRTELVARLVAGPDALRAGVPLVAPPWRRLPDEPRAHIALALAWACKFARAETAERLLELGADPAAADGHRMTALHWAAANGLVGVVRRLLALGAPLEARNVWEGTVLASTAHFAIHMPVEGVDYPDVMELLVAAGADIGAAVPTGDERVDALLRRPGAGAA